MFLFISKIIKFKFNEFVCVFVFCFVLFYNQLSKFLTIDSCETAPAHHACCPYSEVCVSNSSSSLLLIPKSHHFPPGVFVAQPYIDSACQSVQPSQPYSQPAGELMEEDHEAKRLANKVIINSSKGYRKNQMVQKMLRAELKKLTNLAFREGHLNTGWTMSRKQGSQEQREETPTGRI